jgi:molybdenum cofactor cytidylyltransferase
MPRLAALILAAGGSTRMGRPKQLLTYQNQPLVRRAALAALDVGCDPVTVVVGAGADAVTKALEGLEVDQVTNADWERGIGSSIRAGVARFTANTPDALLLMLCDQPLITPVSLRRLIDAHFATHKPVCVSTYADTLGPPVLISASLFPDLMNLPDDRGAKVLWTTNPDGVCHVPCAEGATDVDTPADYAALPPAG